MNGDHASGTTFIVMLTVLVAVACDDPQRPVPTGPRASLIGGANGSQTGPIVLRGTILTPNGVIRHGYVGIVNGRIVAVSAKQPDIPDAVTVNTEGIILPGFIDLHNHVPWNVLPRWSPGRTFTDQPQWADDPEFRAFSAPFDRLVAASFCDMNAWGELRALVGGTTSIMATRSFACIHGLVRNLDYNSGFYGTTELDREHIFNAAGFQLPPPSDVAGRAAFVQVARFLIANPFYEALAMHVAEGTDAYAEEQFTFLQSRALLNPKGILIHGISLGASDFLAMAATGTALVWSPRSNLELYGTTANIAAALDAGVEIALAPDWALTGSSNMLDELKTAAQWNREHLGGRLTDRQLVDLVTSVPAHVAGVDDEVGFIRPGLRADLDRHPWRREDAGDASSRSARFRPRRAAASCAAVGGLVARAINGGAVTDYGFGSCCVRQCKVPSPQTRSTAWIPTTGRSGNSSARMPSATRSLGSLNVGTSTAALAM